LARYGLSSPSVKLSNKLSFRGWSVIGKFFIDVKGAEFGDVNFPKGEIKDDEFFGKIRVHTGEFSVDIPLTNIRYHREHARG
jgi:hypothetical protein